MQKLENIEEKDEIKIKCPLCTKDMIEQKLLFPLNKQFRKCFVCGCENVMLFIGKEKR